MTTIGTTMRERNLPKNDRRLSPLPLALWERALVSAVQSLS
jgi:hypothetical protein